MRETITYVTQSKYFSPAFNAAIFDGPIRIYFAQYQEAQALKLYFNLQERFGEVRKQARGIFKERGRNIFVMLYPNEELFDSCFAQNSQLNQSDLDIAEAGTEKLGLGVGAEAGAPAASSAGCQMIVNRLGLDYVLGVSGPMEDEEMDVLCSRMDGIVHSSEALGGAISDVIANPGASGPEIYS